jgi:hypothetical protein
VSQPIQRRFPEIEHHPDTAALILLPTSMPKAASDVNSQDKPSNSPESKLSSHNTKDNWTTKNHAILVECPIISPKNLSCSAAFFYSLAEMFDIFNRVESTQEKCDSDCPGQRNLVVRGSQTEYVP